MHQLLVIAIRNLATHKLRTLLLGSAIAGVTALFVILMGLSNGIRATMLEAATTLTTGHINVAGFYKATAGHSLPVLTSYPKLLEQVRQEVPELDYMVHRGRGWSRLLSDSNSLQVGVSGIEVGHESGFRKIIQVRQGSLDDLAKPDTLLLFEDQARQLEVKVGDTLTLSGTTLRGTTNTVDVRLVAIASDVGMLSSFNVYVSAPTLRRLYQLRPDATGVLQLYLKDMAAIPAVLARLAKRLPELGYQVLEYNPQPFFAKFDIINNEGWTGQRLDITSWEDEISFIQWTVQSLGALTSLLTFVLLVIISVGVMNTIWIAIRERTQEIGTLRAIGMQRSWVMSMFLLEGLALGLLSTATGALAGLLVCLGLNAAEVSVPVAAQVFTMSERLYFVLSLSSVVSATLFITLCTTLISLVPSFLAARMKPITAIHHVG